MWRDAPDAFDGQGSEVRVSWGERVEQPKRFNRGERRFNGAFKKNSEILKKSGENGLKTRNREKPEIALVDNGERGAVEISPPGCS